MMRTNAGRYRIGDHVVELRSLRLADAASWRRTNLEHEKRLHDAFHDPHVSWEDRHSATAWAEEWWDARAAADVLVSRVLTVDDETGQRVVGQQSMRGPDPRSGHAESLTWVAGLPDSKAITLWLSAVNVLDTFADPRVTALLAVQPVENRGSLALAKALGFTYLQTARSLRDYKGEPADHTIYVRYNTPETRRDLQAIVASVDPQPMPASRAPRPPARAAVDLARISVRRLRARRAAGPTAQTRALPALLHTDDGLDIGFGAPHGGRYPVTVDGAPIGALQVHVDGGSSTTTIIDWLRTDAQATIATAVLVAACRALAEHQDTRRLTIALADRHALAHDALTAVGFSSEGPTLPTIGDEGSPRESWTRLRDDG
ncbi:MULTISPECIES: GNAT family N-acetyltransferase [Tsukamurella]|uniref:GNAT family N-acetyltransferase n=2 Tax=Tsukamurella TaxID=2060 RepID=A0A5C5RZW0_9ACTN|nr:MULTISPECIES: GNAT family N-acetyltransferase [Tsukamurella]NMD58247.1 GNAT family N-acetyltransferase [Tsukamurella columbiensis]TWS28687.1 GNAT family N-acetyltransferase [Tsukamurella conjunctivitidis]